MSLHPKVIVVANGKGGVGKTATAMALLGIFSEKYKVLAVDADSQGRVVPFTANPKTEYPDEQLHQAPTKVKRTSAVRFLFPSLDLW